MHGIAFVLACFLYRKQTTNSSIVALFVGIVIGKLVTPHTYASLVCKLYTYISVQVGGEG